MRFLSEKIFTGAAGFIPTDEVRLSIALQACLPILHLGLKSYAGWSGIIVYPGDFIVPHTDIDENGVQIEFSEEALGEAWDGGPVVLGWFDDPGAYSGVNVVIHEFAHKIDMLNGDADGCPPLHAGMNRMIWQTTLQAAYLNFCERIDRDDPPLLDPYAAEHPGEFFAVCSETFFTQPKALYGLYPDVYAQFSIFYRQNPAGPCFTPAE